VFQAESERADLDAPMLRRAKATCNVTEGSGRDVHNHKEHQEREEELGSPPAFFAVFLVLFVSFVVCYSNVLSSPISASHSSIVDSAEKTEL
jgi:hypothetical protein